MKKKAYLISSCLLALMFGLLFYTSCKKNDISSVSESNANGSNSKSKRTSGTTIYYSKDTDTNTFYQLTITKMICKRLRSAAKLFLTPQIWELPQPFTVSTTMWITPYLLKTISLSKLRHLVIPT